MGPRLLRGVCFGAITVVLSAGAVTAQAATTQGSCPTVTANTGAVSPAATPGVDWSGCDLEDANLASADLDGANLGTADLTGAILQSADLAGADLSKANLTSVDLTKSNTNLADFAGAKLDFANGDGATLTNTNFTGADLSFFSANDLAGSDLQGVNINQANFSGDGVDFEQVRSGGVTGTTPYLPQFWTVYKGYLLGPGADLSGDDLKDWDFSNQNLSDTDLAGTDLTGANLTNVSLADADVQGTIFTGVTWPGLESGDLTGTPAALPANFALVGGYLLGPGAVLVSADLTDANLSGLDLAGVNFYLASLQDANLSGANLTGAFLDDVELTGATWSHTICPDGTNSDNDFGTCVNNLDDTPPVAKPTAKGLSRDHGWFTGPVTVLWHWTDGNATINPAKCPAQTTSSGQGKAVVITGTCYNALGAVGTASETFKIDTTAPVVSVTGVLAHHVYAAGHLPTAGCHTTDATSGVATAAEVVTTPPAGPTGTGKFTAACSGATDKAGNTAAPVSVSYTVGYGFTGFASPKPGSKLAKSAPAIAVTFRLADARGKPLSAASAAKLAGQRALAVTLTGPAIAADTVACHWNSATRYFNCSVKTPPAVKTGKSYQLKVTENVGTGFVTAPVIGKAVNPEVISFT
jgi:uncharacterized protein YjbI with pentapeptide repeats